MPFLSTNLIIFNIIIHFYVLQQIAHQHQKPKLKGSRIIVPFRTTYLDFRGILIPN